MDKVKLSIRKPKLSEHKEVAKVIDSEEPLYKKYFSKEHREWLSIGSFSKIALDKKTGWNSLVALYGNKIVGFVSWYIKPNKVVYICSIEVLPAFQHKGIASKLLKKVESVTKKKGAIALGAESQKKAFWVRDFNLKYGFRKLTEKDLKKKPFKGMFKNVTINPYTYVWGKEMK